MKNYSEESRVYVGLGSEYEQFRRADTRLVSQYGLVEIRTEFSVQHVISLKRGCGASHL